MNIKGISSLLLITCGLLGCQTSVTDQTINDHGLKLGHAIDKSVTGFFDIKGANFKGKHLAKAVNGKLVMGKITIDNWPLEELPCVTCQIEFKRDYFPQGATLMLHMTDVEGKDTWLVSSVKSRVRFDSWWIEYSEDEVKLTEIASKKATHLKSRIKDAIKINSDKKCHALWAYQRKKIQPQPNISDDVAKFKSQLIIQCLK